MDTIIQFITNHATHAHWIIFGALIIAGFNIPVSEDLMIIISAVLAATVIPENTYMLFIFAFTGCYLSDWMVYWMGRLLGRRLWEFRWFAKTFKKRKLYQTQRYFAKYGFLTLLIGRFVPFGIRNCLFLTAGMGKMRFGKFLIADGLACVCSNTLLFTLTYTLGKNYHLLIQHIKTFNIFIFSAFIMTLIAFVWYKRREKIRTHDRNKF